MLNELISSLYKGMHDLPMKATAYVHAACDNTNLNLAKALYKATVTGLNNGIERRIGDIDKSTSPEAYQGFLERMNEGYADRIGNMLDSKSYLESCHIDPNTIAVLSDKAYDVVQVPEFGEMAPFLLGGATLMGLTAWKLYNRKFGNSKLSEKE